jgi:hypothetical protein
MYMKIYMEPMAELEIFFILGYKLLLILVIELS